MNYILLKEYINKLNIDKLNEIAFNNNVYLDNKELNILYKYNVGRSHFHDSALRFISDTFPA